MMKHLCFGFIISEAFGVLIKYKNVLDRATVCRVTLRRLFFVVFGFLQDLGCLIVHCFVTFAYHNVSGIRDAPPTT